MGSSQDDPRSVGWIRQAITASDNSTIDQPWVIAMFAVFVILPVVITSMVVLAAVDVILNKHDLSAGALGGGIASVITAVAAFIAAAAAILRQDRANPQPAAPPPTTTITTTTTTPTQ